MRTNVATWLWCMWRVQRTYRKDGLMFSQRLRFLEELRPFIGSRGTDNMDNDDIRIAYPEAIFWITPTDLKRALSATNDE